MVQIAPPYLLSQIPDPPKQLYVLGTLPDGKYFAVVGTRQMTNYGHQMTVNLTEGLVKAGFVIISGMALGIDGVAHRTALACGGKTVAVLGAGADIIYPPQHKNLYERIIQNGAVISEIAPGQRVAREVFAARNRIISGLAVGVLVVEAGLKSGSLITARLAAEQGREVYAVPGSFGTDYLIDQGASDILTGWI